MLSTLRGAQQSQAEVVRDGLLVPAPEAMYPQWNQGEAMLDALNPQLECSSDMRGDRSQPWLHHAKKGTTRAASPRLVKAVRQR